MSLSFILGLILVILCLKKNFAKEIRLSLLFVGIILIAFAVYLAL